MWGRLGVFGVLVSVQSSLLEPFVFLHYFPPVYDKSGITPKFLSVARGPASDHRGVDLNSYRHSGHVRLHSLR